MHQALRGIDFDAAVPSLLPEHYFLAELRANDIVPIHNLVECTDTDFLAIPEERRQEITAAIAAATSQAGQRLPR